MQKIKKFFITLGYILLCLTGLIVVVALVLAILETINNWKKDKQTDISSFILLLGIGLFAVISALIILLAKFYTGVLIILFLTSWICSFAVSISMLKLEFLQQKISKQKLTWLMVVFSLICVGCSFFPLVCHDYIRDYVGKNFVDGYWVKYKDVHVRYYDYFDGDQDDMDTIAVWGAKNSHARILLSAHVAFGFYLLPIGSCIWLWFLFVAELKRRKVVDEEPKRQIHKKPPPQKSEKELFKFAEELNVPYHKVDSLINDDGEEVQLYDVDGVAYYVTDNDVFPAGLNQKFHCSKTDKYYVAGEVDSWFMH